MLAASLCFKSAFDFIKLKKISIWFHRISNSKAACQFVDLADEPFDGTLDKER